jgi:DNA-binding response OmpR family regulator
MAKVLIVEDDPLISRMYQKIFTFENFDVEVAANGEEALAKVSDFNPALILLDVMMPKMNGLQGSTGRLCQQWCTLCYTSARIMP